MKRGPDHNVGGKINDVTPIMCLSESHLEHAQKCCVPGCGSLRGIGGIDVDHISHGDDHVHGSSSRAHKVAPPATWRVPEGVKHFRWP